MIDMTGFKNESLSVIGFYGKRGRKPLWLCICKCGKEIIRDCWQIRNGYPKSCGCYVQARRGNKLHHAYHTKHGLSKKHRLYGTWQNMKQRCYNPNNSDYKSYGGKGISVCDEWKNDSCAFLKWGFSNGWAKGLVIDRIDSSGNYSPENCRFITMSENSKKVHLEHPLLNRGVNHKDATVTEEQVKEVKKSLLRGETQTSIINRLGISRNIVWQIAHNRTWKSIKIEGAI